MDKDSKKDVTKLQKKLRPGITLNELLQQEHIVDLYRLNTQAVSPHLKFKDYRDMVTYITVVGPQQDRQRSYKYPFVSSQILSSEVAKNIDNFFAPISDDPGSPILFLELLRYFDGQSNYVLSGYVMKVIQMLYKNEPIRTQNALIESGASVKMIKFISSSSVADFLLKFVIVENEMLLNMHFKERKEVFDKLIGMYEANALPAETLSNVQYMLTEAIVRLWSQKHKELGRFSQQMLKLIEVIIEKNNLYEQESLIFLVMKHLTGYLDDAPMLIKMLLKKIYKQLTSIPTDLVKSTFKQTIPRFGIKNLKILQALSVSFMSCQSIIESLIPTMNIFGMLVGLLTRYEWNNALHIEIQKIFKEAFKSKSNEMFRAIFKKGNFGEVSKDIIRKEQPGKQSKGYMGCFINILMSANEAVKKETEFGQFLKRQQARFIQTIDRYLNPKAQLYVFDLAGYKTVHSFAKPHYDTNQVLQQHKDFLQMAMLPQVLLQSHDSGILQQAVLNEMQDENKITLAWAKQDDPVKQACLDK